MRTFMKPPHPLTDDTSYSQRPTPSSKDNKTLTCAHPTANKNGIIAKQSTQPLQAYTRKQANPDFNQPNHQRQFHHFPNPEGQELSLRSSCLLGRDTGLRENPLGQDPFPRFVNTTDSETSFYMKPTCKYCIFNSPELHACIPHMGRCRSHVEGNPTHACAMKHSKMIYMQLICMIYIHQFEKVSFMHVSFWCTMVLQEKECVCTFVATNAFSTIPCTRLAM